jgi:hypothetical protein
MLGAFALLCLASANLAGCVTDQSATATAAPVAIPPGQAVVTITRAEGFQGSLMSATVDANGARLASIANGAAFTGGIKPGPVTLTVSMWGSPGGYTVRFNAEPGKRYAFEITPRSELMVAGLAAGTLGVFAEAAINGEQSGPFKLVAVPNAR